MRQQYFHQNWKFSVINGTKEPHPVILPHDALTEEQRRPDSPSKHNMGWFEAHDYCYTNTFTPDPAWKGQKVLMEFEGVYHHAEVYLNGTKVAERPYGYSNFYADLTDSLNFSGENELKVVANCAAQPNSRWYSGGGIYRPVSIWTGERDHHIEVNGLRVKTLSIQPAILEVTVLTVGTGTVTAELCWQGKTVCTQQAESDGKAVFRLEVPDAKLWSCEEPNLYHLTARFGQDSAETTVGIRTLEWNEEKGFAINGERVILRGACFHHDNGLLGAIADPEAEERKVRILKENGYNALRSAHNPCSKAMLDACDQLGMLMMDEFVDCWYIHKTKYDYVDYFEQWWQQDLKDMVEKDYNHPSVIMYSTGNEVSETAQPKGIALTGQMTEWLHSLDDTRPVTCGINIFFNFLSSAGFGVYSDEKAEQAVQEKKKKPSKLDAVGSEFYNTLASMLGDKAMKIGATLPPCDWKTKDAFANMDIAGYNYGIYRYKGDLKKYPHRLILGSETFCQDAYAFWELAKKEPRLIGDFVWAGMDYIGETGVGRWDYLTYDSQPASDDAGWLCSGAGRIDILGNPTAEALYTRVALERETGPYIAVRPVCPVKKPQVGAWNLTDAISSWSWHGGDENPAQIEVYARGSKAALYLNGTLIGEKSLEGRCRVVFQTQYHDGELKAICYDRSGKEIDSYTLKTAEEKTVLVLRPEQNTAQAGKLVYIHLTYEDENGIWKPMEHHMLTASVEGGTLLGFGNTASFNEEGFWQGKSRTYWGRAMAVIRADGSGDVKLTVQDEERSWNCVVPIVE